MLNRNINDLHPIMREPVKKLEGVLLGENLLAAGTAPGFRLFEGYRSPERQDQLFRQKGAAVTQARAWQSAHQYGLAVDYVWWTGQAWSWDASHPWEDLRSAAFMTQNLRTPLKWDLPHIEHPAWEQLRKVIPHLR